MKSDAATLDARRIHVRGIVQGVGFRPFVAGLAVRYGVTGWIRNDGGRVTIHAEAAPDVLDAFATAIRTEAPPLALVEAVESTATSRGGHTTFAVDPSIDADTGPRLAPPDAATCTRCLEELFDPMDRRFAYPFINCTNCGPRFTIITSLPYDRGNTSMRGFTMCPNCRREYEDPADRRYHAEPIAMPDVRTAAAARGSGGTADRGGSGRARRGAAAVGLDRRRERARRVPARVRWAGRSRRPRAPHTEAPAGQAVRGHGPRPGRGSPALRSIPGRGGGARIVARPDRAGGRSRNPRARGRPGSPTARRDASLDAGASPPRAGRGDPARHDEWERERRADLHRR